MLSKLFADVTRSLMSEGKLGALTDLMLETGYCTEPKIMSVDSTKVECNGSEMFIRVLYRYKDCELTGNTVDACVCIYCNEDTVTMTNE